jgi:hypothetical protein
MKARVKASDCKIKVITYFHEYYLNFNAGDILEIEIDEKGCRGLESKMSSLKTSCKNFKKEESK